MLSRETRRHGKAHGGLGLEACLASGTFFPEANHRRVRTSVITGTTAPRLLKAHATQHKRGLGGFAFGLDWAKITVAFS